MNVQHVGIVWYHSFTVFTYTVCKKASTGVARTTFNCSSTTLERRRSSVTTRCTGTNLSSCSVSESIRHGFLFCVDVSWYFSSANRRIARKLSPCFDFLTRPIPPVHKFSVLWTRSKCWNYSSFPRLTVCTRDNLVFRNNGKNVKMLEDKWINIILQLTIL